MKSLQVALGERSYPIFIGSGITTEQAIAPYIKGKQVMIVTNETIAPLYLEPLLGILAGFSSDTTILPDGERFKTVDSVNRIFDQLLTRQHNRTTTLIALGGGVIGDMTGFAAACYQRGVEFIQVPTTLLSQVDSSVGGKTGVNHALGKNMIGAFHQPKAVFIDTNMLATLHERELSAGLAEVIKYGLIKDIDFLDWIEKSLDAILRLETSALTQAISRSCEIKAEIVAADEREQGIRAILNLGHTFGHAIEAYTQYKNWLHGEAVAVGILMAADLSARHGYINRDEVKRVEVLIQRAKLPVNPPQNMNAADFLKYMAVDKKAIDGKIRLILMKKTGQAFITDDYSMPLLQDTLRSFTKS